jgi:hypothetical protein
MSTPVTRRGRSTTGRSSRRIVTLRPETASVRAWIVARAMGVRRAWAVAVVRARKAAQDRIVLAFRLQVEGSGPGPTDAELRTFARLDVAEQRLRRSHCRAKVGRYRAPSRRSERGDGTWRPLAW